MKEILECFLGLAGGLFLPVLAIGAAWFIGTVSEKFAN
jgi:hypothetical protein